MNYLFKKAWFWYTSPTETAEGLGEKRRSKQNNIGTSESEILTAFI